MVKLYSKGNRFKYRFGLLLTLIFFISQNHVGAQDFGDVGIEDFAVVLSEKDSSASAVYLLHNVYIQYMFVGDKLYVEYKIHDRIKILKTDGEKYGNVEVGLRNQSSYKEKMTGIKGFSFNLVDGKVEKTKLAKSEIYDEDTADEYRKRKFAMPNVKEGTIVDIQYTLSQPFGRSVKKWYFQEEVPVKYSELKVDIPEYFEMTPIPTGFVPLETEESVFRSAVFNGVKYRIWAKDIPALKDDDYVLNINDYRSGLKYEISKVSWRNGQVDKYSSSWDEIAKDLYASQYFGPALKKRFKSLDLQVVLAKKLEGKERVKFLYDFVRENFEWNGEYGIYINNIKQAVDTKTANVAELNLLLVNLLRRAECDVKPALIKTRSRGLLNPNFPSLTEFNYVVGEVTVGDEVFLVDATDKFIPMGSLPKRATGFYYFTIEEYKGTIKNIANPNSHDVINMLSYEVDLEEKALVGNGQYRYSNHAASNKRRSNYSKNNVVSKEKQEEDEPEDEDGYEDLRENVTTTISVSEEHDIYKPITYVLEELLYDELKIIEDKIFINACLDSKYDENPFTEETRQFPVFYSSKGYIKRSHKIKIPEGYKTEFLPGPVVVTIGEGEGKFIYECIEIQGDIVVGINLIIGNEVILPEQYEAVKQFYEIIAEKHAEKIILTKI